MTHLERLANQVKLDQDFMASVFFELSLDDDTVSRLLRPDKDPLTPDWLARLKLCRRALTRQDVERLAQVYLIDAEILSAILGLDQ
jgi:hypothetical protein